MGKKGSKRKTRWRTLSIGPPPGEEDEEDGLRNGYVKRQDSTSSMHGFDRKGQDGYKPRRTGTGSSSSGYASRSQNGESSGSPSQSNIMINEDEYMKISTPRQDILFKKGYLSKKKPWTGNASTSATPSTTESQSASHSTADGSETTEDQQLLDRDCVPGEQPPTMESRAHLGYGTFYDHASGYYYEYPVMVLGPAPITHVEPGYMAAMPYKPVPLKPVEWVNPAYVPKLNGQPYCMVHYQSGQGAENTAVVEELETPVLPLENSNGTWNESGTGSASCNGSVVGEAEEQAAEGNTVAEAQADDQQPEEQIVGYTEEQQYEEHPMENGVNRSYMEPILMQPPMHVSHMVPAVPQPYMYPGHYMFGLPLVNVNGVTIQGGPMTRIMGVTSMSSACAKRRKKKKRRKQRTLATGNTEDEEEEYSSEGDTGLSSSRLSWTACSSSTSKPLNPKCQDFQMRPTVLEAGSLSAIQAASNFEECSTTSQSSTMSSDANSVDKSNEACNGDEPKDDSANDRNVGQSSDPDNEANRLTNCIEETTQEAEKQVNNDASKLENDSSSGNEEKQVEEETLVNGKMDSDSNNEDIDTPVTEISSRQSSTENERTRSRSATPKTVEQDNTQTQETNVKMSGPPKRKYSAKGTKFVREATPGPDLEGTAEVETEKPVVQELAQNLESVNLSYDTKLESSTSREQVEDEALVNIDRLTKEDVIEASNEDSGFESQTRLSDYPITEAVTEWLRRANSPDIFVTNSVDSETEEEPDEEPPKNLQGNPMPALSAKSGDAALSRATSCGEFARTSNVKDQPETRRRSSKRRSRTKRADGRLDDAVSSSDSCQQEGPARKRNPARQADVGEVCEFTEKDSVAGMRVASISRMDSKRVTARRARGRKSGREEGNTEDSLNVKTFEKGEIVVSEDGKLLATTTAIGKSDTTKETSKKTEEKSSEEENVSSQVASLESIEEPDVLECWEAETIEPVITPKKMLQSRGVLCEGEAAEEDNPEVEQVQYVQKYYRLARASASSVEEEASVDSMKSVPNNCKQTDEVPEGKTVEIPVDEAFEVYESCYTGSAAPFMAIDSKGFKSRTLYGQDGDGPIPCRAVCCNIQ